MAASPYPAYDVDMNSFVGPVSASATGQWGYAAPLTIPALRQKKKPGGGFALPGLRCGYELVSRPGKR
ncbi:hypothetical protein CIT292_10225 [Citrobacter youngae ATCC 29220]|uniref:Uncharacterized protein n=1 Tax=Citrobacter youngae ATCC 29220 TaxID=500640 RepID=D4BI61_9ENTR|nr:hypothetical protein CIT292_10225 [Citrobacter youngae ATCC 29220]